MAVEDMFDFEKEEIDIVKPAIGPGKVVAVLPAMNMALAPTIEVIGLQEMGWMIQIKDSFGSIAWQRLLIGREL